jgi:hypothetical protein
MVVNQPPPDPDPPPDLRALELRPERRADFFDPREDFFADRADFFEARVDVFFPAVDRFDDVRDDRDLVEVATGVLRSLLRSVTGTCVVSSCVASGADGHCRQHQPHAPQSDAP